MSVATSSSVLHAPSDMTGRLLRTSESSRQMSVSQSGPRYAGGRWDGQQHGCARMLLRPTTAAAAGLLVVLVIHLAYMASPFHAMMVTEHPDAREMMHGDIDGHMVEAAQAADHGRDCSIEWTTSTQTVWLTSPPVLAAASI